MAEAKKICPRCRRENRIDARSCRYCRNEFPRRVVRVQRELNVPMLILFSVLLVVLLAGVGGLIYYIRSRSTGQKDNTNPAAVVSTSEDMGQPDETGEAPDAPKDSAEAGVQATKTTEQVDESLPVIQVEYALKDHVSEGFSAYSANGNMAGSSGEGKQLEAIKIKLSGNPKLGIEYATYCQRVGWMDWVNDDEIGGTVDESKRMEAIMIRLTGEDKDKYDVYYRVHAQQYGWMEWTMNGEPAGSKDVSKRLEAIQIAVLKKGENKPGIDYADVNANEGIRNENSFVDGEIRVSYKTHLQKYGWLEDVKDGAVSGKPGEEKQLEAFSLNLENQPYGGSISYRAMIQGGDWQEWKKEGETAGTVGESKKVKAIEMMLDGRIGDNYSIYYRVLTLSNGWLGWAKNGEPAGDVSDDIKILAIQAVILPNNKKIADEYAGVKADVAEPTLSPMDEYNMNKVLGESMFERLTGYYWDENVETYKRFQYFEDGTYSRGPEASGGSYYMEGNRIYLAGTGESMVMKYYKRDGDWKTDIPEIYLLDIQDTLKEWPEGDILFYTIEKDGVEMGAVQVQRERVK